MRLARFRGLAPPALLVAATSAAGATEPTPPPDASSQTEVVCELCSQERVTGNWGGLRDTFESHGLTIALDGTYTFQRVASGGLDGPVFRAISDEEDNGHTISGDLRVELDTGKAGLWEGGSFLVRGEGRAGRSVLERAGSVSAVNIDALFPNVVDRFDEDAIAVTELSYSQDLGDAVALYGGLLDTSEGDANEIAGSALSNQHFLNGALLYSMVEDATVPNTSLGGGLLFEPCERLTGSLLVFGTAETAGEDPFDGWHGTTFSTEWTIAHTLFDHEGAQTLGFLYGIDAERANIAADPRIVIASAIIDLPTPTTRANTWAFYYNAHQFLIGDEDRGLGAFVRFGISDGDPNFVHWTVAGGFGGTGLLPSRRADRWGLGVFYVEMSGEDLLRRRGVDHEVGGELFYDFAVTPWLQLTADAQLIDSALPASDTAIVLAVRTRVEF